MTDTPFALWRDAMRVTQFDAARLLAVSPRTIGNWERGFDGAGNPSKPPYATLCLMTQLARGETPKPWAFRVEPNGGNNG